MEISTMNALRYSDFQMTPKCMADAAVHSMENKPRYYWYKYGLSTPKISSNGSGSALMKNPLLCGEIVKAVTSAVDVPLRSKFVELEQFCRKCGWSCKNLEEKLNVILPTFCEKWLNTRREHGYAAGKERKTYNGLF